MKTRLRPGRAAGLIAALVAVAGVIGFPAAAAPQAHTRTASLQGTVSAAGRPLADAKVTLYRASQGQPSVLGHATTDASGRFSISYLPPPGGVTYADATTAQSGRLLLRAVVSDGGAVPSALTVDELTTVSAAFALAQFSAAGGVSGPSPGLENAAATAFNLADSMSGKPGTVVLNANNGGTNDTLATLGSLSNLVSLCAGHARARCAAFIRLATPPGGTTPSNTVAALVDLARNPTLSRAGLFALSHRVKLYQPALGKPPAAWILVLLYTETNLYASGRIAIDSKGNVWSSVNWLPGTKTGSPYVTVLDPTGRPTLGTPIEGGGMKGGAWGAAVAPGDGNVWMGSFGGAAISQYSAGGKPLSPSDGWTNGALNHPQGIAIDQKGNVWIANNYGPESEPGQGDVVVYPGGDPAKAITITGGGLNHPFAIQIDGYGRAWVTNAGPGGAKLVGTRAAILVGKFGGSVTVIDPDFKPTSFSPIQSGSFKWPLGLAIDSENNAWTANYFSSTVTEIGPSGTVSGVVKLPHGTLPWSEAIDGSDRVWVAGFGRPAVWLLCGANPTACPPGSATGMVLSPRDGFRSKAFQHFTSIQIDQSGNVWLSNNWSQLAPPVGGNGITEIIGAATPVCTPLQPLPSVPSSGSTTCPVETAAWLSAPSAGSGHEWAWIVIGLGAAVLLVAAGVFFVGRHRPSGSAGEKVEQRT